MGHNENYSQRRRQVLRSIAAAPLTATQPYSYLQLVWALIFGYLLFDETPDLWVCVGAAVIDAAITSMTHREAVAARQEKDLLATGQTIHPSG